MPDHIHMLLRVSVSKVGRKNSLQNRLQMSRGKSAYFAQEFCLNRANWQLGQTVPWIHE